MADNNIDDWQEVDDWEEVNDWEEAPSQPDPNEMSAGAALLQGAGQGISAGWGDELTATAGAAWDKYFGGNKSDLSYADLYKARRDAIRRRDKSAEEQHPTAFTTGQVGGALASAVVPAGGLAKGAGWAKNVGAGMLSGAGTSEAESLPELAEDTAEGGALGFGLGALFGGAGKVGNKIAGKFKKVAEDQAVDSLGPMLADEKALANKGLRDQLGRELLDEGVTTFGSSPAKQADRLAPLLSKKGQVIGEIRDTVDKQARKAAQAGDELGAVNRQVDFNSALAKRAERAGKAAKEGTTKDVDVAKEVAKEAAHMGDIPLRSLRDTGKIVKKLGDQIPFHKHVSEWGADDLARYQVYKNLQRQMDGKIRGFTDRFDEYQDAKNMFGMFKDGEKIAEKAAMRGKGDLAPGLKDLVTAGGGNKNLVDKIVDATTLKFVRDRGHSMIAKTADTAYKLLSTSPEVMGKYNGPLTQALKRGNKAFFTTHMMLMNQDPEYAEMVQQMTPEDTDG